MIRKFAGSLPHGHSGFTRTPSLKRNGQKRRAPLRVSQFPNGLVPRKIGQRVPKVKIGLDKGWNGL